MKKDTKIWPSLAEMWTQDTVQNLALNMYNADVSPDNLTSYFGFIEWIESLWQRMTCKAMFLVPNYIGITMEVGHSIEGGV